MAELETSCCGPEGCEPCGCPPAANTEGGDVREFVREKYAAAAVAAATGASCCSPADVEIAETHRVH